MLNRNFTRIGQLTLSMLLVTCIAAAAEENKDGRRFLWRIAVNNTLDEDAQDQYWLGIQASPLSDILKSQLKISSGLLIDEVVSDAPAEQAGLRRHDILLRFADLPVDGLESLTEAVADSMDTEQEAEILRAGERMTLHITPAKRPDDVTIPVPRLADRERVRTWLREFEDGRESDPLRLRFMGPGLALPKGAGESRIRLPENTRITIEKSGNEPASITVQRDDETWEVTEDRLEDLPEDIRPIVKRMFGGGWSAEIDLRGLGGEDWWNSLTDNETAGQLLTEVERWMDRFNDARQGNIPQFKAEELQDLMGEVRRRVRDFRDQRRDDDSLDDMRRELRELREDVEQLRDERNKDKDA